MKNKNFYKKIFVGVAALFLLFAPVGMTTKNTTSTPVIVPAGASITQNTLKESSFSPYSAFRLTFNLNLAEATAPIIGGTGVGAGTTKVSNKVDFFSCASQPATCGVYYVALTVNGIMSLFLVLSAWLVELSLQFNQNIFNSPAVQIGFSVALAIANLGFVLGIIVIAIATIIRNQTYGIKQLLWKLVMMAILVNFGLVITAPIVGFADSMSTYFINATSPPSTAAGFAGYVNTLTGAFNPQSLETIPPAGSAGSGSIWSSICASAIAQKPHLSLSPQMLLAGVNGSFWGLCKATNTPTPTQPEDNFWQSTIAMIFSVVFSAIAVFTFLCLAVLLLIRYLMLGGLLIILPLAWLTYVFPKFDNSYSKWWNTFVKWTFFPPLALFFIYLAFSAAVITNTANNHAAATYAITAIGGTGTDISLQQGVATETGLGVGIMAQAADEVLLVGLMIMGLLFASSLAGKAGSTAVNIGSSAGKAVSGYAGRKAKKGAARAYQGIGGGRINTVLQKSRIPFISTIGRGAANLTEAGTKNQVDARHKAMGLGDMSNDRLKVVAQGLTAREDQLAALKEFHKRKILDDNDVLIGGKKLGGPDGWLRKNQSTFKNFDQGALGKDVDAALVSNETIRRAAEAKAAASANATVFDENGFMGTAGATVSASAMKDRANEIINKTDEAKAAARTTATVVDDKGIVGPAGATVLASDMTARANEVAEKAQALVKRSGADTFVPHNGSMVRAGDLLKYAQEASKGAGEAMNKKEEAASLSHNGVLRGAGDLAKEAGAASQKADEAIDKKGGDAPVADTENILGKGAGQIVKAGELMQAAAEKFWEGKDKGDVSKMNMSALFSGKAKFGMDEKALKEVGKSVAHGIATQAPSLAGTVAGNIDNWKQLTEFTNTYKRSIDEAERTNKMTAQRAEALRDAINKILASKLSFIGGPAPMAAPAAVPPPTPRTP